MTVYREEPSNNFTTTLAVSIAADATALSVGGVAGLAATGYARFKIDNELVGVVLNGTTSWTGVERGLEGTTATSHTAGAGVALYLTAGLLDHLVAVYDEADALVATVRDLKVTGNATVTLTGGKAVIDVPTPTGLALAAAPASDQTVSGLTATFTAGENLAFGEVCYLAATGKMLKGDANALATAFVVAMAAATIAADASGAFLLLGFARNDAWAWSVGGIVYLDAATAGAMTQTAPSGADDVALGLGVATHADRVFFRPSGLMVEHV